MHFQRDTPVVGTRRPHLVLRLLIASIALVLCLQSAGSPARADHATRGRCASVSALLARTSNGMLMPSESDYPFTPFTWTNAARRRVTPARVLALTGRVPETAVQVVELGYFFRNLADRQPWHDPQQARDVVRFKRLKRAFERHLSDVRVYRVGTVRIDAYIVGRCGRNLIGLSTTLIET